MPAKGKYSQSRNSSNVRGAAGQQDVSPGEGPTSGQLIFNMALAIFGMFAAAIMFSLGIDWASHGNVSAGIGLILAGLFLFWRGGKRLTWTCAEIKMRQQQ